MADHFSMSEMVSSGLAARYKIDNTPPYKILMKLGLMVVRMEAIRKHLGGYSIHTESCYRCEALEMVACAVEFRDWCNERGLCDDQSAREEFLKDKDHPKGTAIDFTCDGFGTTREVAEALRNSGFKFKHIRDNPSWVHLTFYENEF